MGSRPIQQAQEASVFCLAQWRALFVTVLSESKSSWVYSSWTQEAIFSSFQVSSASTMCQCFKFHWQYFQVFKSFFRLWVKEASSSCRFFRMFFLSARFLFNRLIITLISERRARGGSAAAAVRPTRVRHWQYFQVFKSFFVSESRRPQVQVAFFSGCFFSRADSYLIV